MTVQTKQHSFMARSFAKSQFNTRVKSANTTKSEAFFGYFLGPCMASLAIVMLGGSYLTQFYTDVLGISGYILVFMPFFSKIIDAITNVIMGRIIDKTRTVQGKARPWILISGVLIALAGILLYTVPTFSHTAQIIWIIASYNIFFAFAVTIYNMSHILMVPLATRITKQRDSLALLSNAGVSMIPGMIGNVIMPFLIAKIGVGAAAQGNWILVMSLLSCFAIPGILLEYYFTKERVTEEAIRAGEFDDTSNQVTFKEQAKIAFKNKYWLIVMGVTLVFGITNFLGTNSMIYFSNWVVGNSVESGASIQFMINVIGQSPLGFGILALWPLVGRFGKRRVLQVGFFFAGIGGILLVFFAHSGLPAILAALIFRSIGSIPYYVMSAQLAEAMDHIEWETGIRVDGFSAGVYSVIMTVVTGIGQSILLGGINAFGYIAPSSAQEVITQPAAVQNFFIFCFAGAGAISAFLLVLLMIRFDLEEKMPQISADITQRRIEEAAARGEVYITPDELARLEQEENDRIAEENRLKELKAKCAKKGLDFDAEEAKYQAKLAEKAEKARLKAEKKNKKKGH